MRQAHLLAGAALVAMAAAKDQGSAPPPGNPPEGKEGDFDFAGAQARFETSQAENAKLVGDLAKAEKTIDGLNKLVARLTDERDRLGHGLDKANDRVEGLTGELAGVRDDLAEALGKASEPEKPLPTPTNLSPTADRDRLGAAIFHQVQVHDRPLSVMELAGSLKVRFAAVVEAAEAYDFLTLSAPDETGVVGLTSA